MRERLIRASLVLALLVAAVALYLAFTTGRDEEAPVRQGAVLRVFPSPDTVALRQDAIGADLDFGYVATITVDSRIIPEDQLDVVAGINRVSFTPGEAKEIEQLDEGSHCATIAYRKSTEPEAAAKSYRWCFTAA